MDLNDPALLQVTIARTPDNFGPRRAFNVKAEMASGPRPVYHRNSKVFERDSPRKSVQMDVEFVPPRAQVRNFCRKLVPLFAGAVCFVSAISSLCADYRSRVENQYQHQYERFARAHNETFDIEQGVPTVGHIVGTLSAYRNERFGLQETGLMMLDNRTPDPPVRQQPLELLAIGPAKVAAEAVRSHHRDDWRVYVPTSTNDLVNYNGTAFADCMLIAGGENVNFPANKTHSLLMDKGLVVHHIPLQSSFLMNGESILKRYHDVFGKKQVRVDIVQPGSTLILASKNTTLPKSPASDSYLASHQHFHNAAHVASVLSNHEFLTFY